MSRFTEDEFVTAFGQVPHEYPQDVNSACNNFFKILLTNTPESVYATISKMPDKNKGEMNECLKTIIGNTSIDQLNRFIGYVNDYSVNSANILEIMNQEPQHMGIPIFKVCLQMLQNKERGSLQAPPASALFESAPTSAPFASARPSAPFASALFESARPSALPSTRPPTSTIAKDAETKRIDQWWALVDAGKLEEAQRDFAANKGAPYRSGVGGGSRRRRSSHRKRKSYRKSKRVRHTRRKQTRRHRHRHSRHRR